MSGSKTDLIVLDLDLLAHKRILSDDQLQDLLRGTAGRDIVQLVVHTIVMAYELKHPSQISGMAHWAFPQFCMLVFTAYSGKNVTDLD